MDQLTLIQRQAEAMRTMLTTMQTLLATTENISDTAKADINANINETKKLNEVLSNKLINL
ncbi:MAG: hypothetical protein WC707_06855 [Candidatus Babeliaceae bacterium]|jgi:hypothetical protein